MRVTKSSDGVFLIEDEPMRLEGEAADQFIHDMTQRELIGEDTARRSFIAECDRAYELSVAKRTAR
jgi:hypothetical protein